jgi:trehalose-6-phosphate synthase
MLREQRNDQNGTLVLSEFTGAADELAGAFLVNPHDIEGMKDAIVRAALFTVAMIPTGSSIAPASVRGC